MNLSLRFEPIVERRSMPIAPLTVAILGSFGDQNMHVIGGRQQQRMRFLPRRLCGLLLGNRGFPV
jgi:hypothetical protein